MRFDVMACGENDIFGSRLAVILVENWDGGLRSRRRGGVRATAVLFPGLELRSVYLGPLTLDHPEPDCTGNDGQ